MKSFIKDERAMLFQLLIGAGMAIIIFFAIIFIGTFINSTISQELLDSFDISVTGQDQVGGIFYNDSEFANYYNHTLRNLSGDYDSVIDSLAVAAVVMAITLPLAAVVAIRKFF